MNSRLRERWHAPGRRELAEEVIARLVSGRPLGGLDIGMVDGLLDLRGLPAPVPRRLGRFEAAGWFADKLGELVEFRGARLSGLDLSGARLQSFRFHDSQITGCRFAGASCQDWRLWGTQVSDCSFAGADLRDAAVGTWREGRRNAWRRVDFCGADFRVAVSRMAVYEDCSFSGARLAKTRFDQCALTRCRFAGEVREVVFDGRGLTDRPAPPPMQGVDFMGAVFSEVEFMGDDLAGIVLPQDPDLRLIRHYRCVIERALSGLHGDDSLPARMLRAEFANSLKMMRAGEESSVFNRRDYLESGGEELVALAERVLRDGESDCG